MVTSKRVAKDIMTRRVHTVRPTDPLREVIDVICRHRVGGVPVVDGKGLLVGLISERDILLAMHPGTADEGKSPRRRSAPGLKDLNALLARDVMVTQVITAPPETEFLRLASIMTLKKIRRIPIVVERKLVGIVSHGDVYRAIFGTRGRAALGLMTQKSGVPPGDDSP